MKLRKRFIFRAGLLTVSLMLIVGLNAGFALSAEKPYAGVTIRISADATPPTYAKQKLVGEFEEKTGIKVVFDILPYPSMLEKQMAELVAHTGYYDIVSHSSHLLGRFADGGHFEDIQPYLNNPELKYPGFDIENIVPNLRVQYNEWPKGSGHYYGLPWLADAYILYYRKDLIENPVEQANFKAKYGYELSAPKTWDQMRDISEFFTRDTDEDGLTDFYGYTLAGAAGNPGLNSFLQFYLAFGGKYYDKEMKPVWNSPAGVKALEFFKDLMKFMPLGVTGYGYGEAITELLNGNTFAISNWSQFWAMCDDPTKSKVVGKIAYIPVPGGITEKPHMGGWGFGIAKDSKHKEAAWLFMQWVDSVATEMKTVPEGASPTTFTVFMDPELSAKFPALRAIFDSIRVGEAHPNHPESEESFRYGDTAVLKALTGILSPKEALDEWVKKEYKMLKRHGYYKK